MSRTYITDLRHFLNECGEIPTAIPEEARELASFLALIVDEVTSQFPDTNFGVETAIRCRGKKCQGKIIGALDGPEEEIHWHCLDCGQNGVISNWHRSKWDNTDAVTG